MKTLKIIYKITPKLLVLIFLIAIILKSSFGKLYIEQIYPNLLLNYAFILLFYYVGLVFHEFGHLFFAKIMGGTPKRVVFGYGNLITKFNFFKIKIHIKKKLYNGGLAYSTFDSKENIKIKKIFNSSGGFITNFLLALIAFLIFGFKIEYFVDFGIYSIAGAFIITNFLKGILNLIPYKIKSEGAMQPNDGMNVWNILNNKDDFFNEINSNEFFDAYELFENGKYEQAIPIFEKFLEKKPDELSVLLNLGACYIEIIQLDKALIFLNKLEELIKNGVKFNYTHFLYVNKTYICLLKDDFENAEKYSEMAHKIAAKNMPVMLIRGASLIFTDKINKGIKILEKLVDFDTFDYTITASIFLTYAYFLKNKTKLSEKYYNYLQTNQTKIIGVNKMFYDKIIKKISNLN